MKRNRFQPSFLLTFTFLSLITTIVIASALAYFLQDRLVSSVLEQEASSAADQVQLVLLPILTADDFQNLTPSKLSMLDSAFGSLDARRKIFRIKIWNPEGKLIYIDDKEFIGQTFPISDELAKALKGELATEVSDLDLAENISERKLTISRALEIYVPVVLRNGSSISGAFEIYYDYQILEPRLQRLQLSTYSGVGLGIFVLYISLFVLVRRASRELIRRNEENVQLFEAEQSRREELGSLYDLSRQLVETDSVNAIAELVVQHAVPTIHTTLARVLLRDDDELVIRAAHPIRYLEHDLGVGSHQKIAALPFTRRVLAEKRTVVIASASSEFDDTERAALFLGIAQTACFVPLGIGDQVIGLLILGEARSDQREPFTPEKLRLAASIGEQAATALHRASLRERNARLFEQTKQQANFLATLADELQESYTTTLAAMSAALDARDRETEGHSLRVAQLTCEIAKAMGIVSDREQKIIERGALLHDIGKIGISDTILRKPGPLTDAEWVQMKKHPELGANMLRGIKFLEDSLPIVSNHQERWDGSGYPRALKGEEIPLPARIFAVADVYDALTSDRPYRSAWTHEQAVEYVCSRHGTDFDPRVLETFCKLMLARKQK